MSRARVRARCRAPRSRLRSNAPWRRTRAARCFFPSSLLLSSLELSDTQVFEPEIPSSEPLHNSAKCVSIPPITQSAHTRFRAKREQLERFYGLQPESQGQNLAVPVLYVPRSLDSGYYSTFPLLLDCRSGHFTENESPHPERGTPTARGAPARALPTETQVESGTSQSKSGTSVNLSNSGKRD